MRPIQKIILHCSATDAERHDNIKYIDNLHTSFGWDGIGYNFFIDKSGALWLGRPIHKVPAATYGHNRTSIAICVSGLKYFKNPQFDSLKKLCLNLVITFGLGHTNIHAHNEFNKNKTCPVFDIEPIKFHVEQYIWGSNWKKKE